MNPADFLSPLAVELLIVLGPLFAIPLLAFVIAAPLRRRARAPESAQLPSPVADAPLLEEPVASAAPQPELAEPAVVERPRAEPIEPARPELVPEPARKPAPAPEPQLELQLEPVSEPAAIPEPVAAPEPEPVVEAPRPRISLRERLTGTSQTLVGRLSGMLSGRTIDSELLDDLEAVLFTADLGVSTAESLLEVVKKEGSGRDAGAVQEILRDAILAKLKQVEPVGDPLALSGGPPHVILVLGVNGSGKTTTIGKLAARYHGAGKKVVLGAGDTFRAAASEQLQVWGERVGCDVVQGKAGGDPAAVAFDTVKAARARGADVAIIDTAGRLQTRQDLMAELGKIARVIGREIPDAPHETLLVLDSNTGQNALSQARLFTEATQVTALALTKLDGTAKGGVIVGLADQFGIPVRYVGVGEGIDDLQDFEAEPFVDAIFAT